MGTFSIRHRAILVFALPIVAGGSVAFADASASLDGSARYMAFSGTDQSSTLLLGAPLDMDLHYRAPGVPSPQPDHGRAAGHAQIGGSVGALAWASGFNPNFGPPSEVHGRMIASATTPWRIESATLAPDTPVLVHLALRIDGAIYGGMAEAGRPAARIDATLDVDGVRRFSAGSEMTNWTHTVSGAWSLADFAYGPYSFEGWEWGAYHIDRTDVVTFMSTVGGVNEVGLKLDAQASAPGPWEIYNICDFLNSGRYTLTGVDPATGAPLDVSFVALPAPGAGAMALMAGACLGLRRRRVG